jgi:uncharacterized membrane-anchored protein
MTSYGFKVSRFFVQRIVDGRLSWGFFSFAFEKSYRSGEDAKSSVNLLLTLDSASFISGDFLLLTVIAALFHHKNQKLSIFTP